MYCIFTYISLIFMVNAGIYIPYTDPVGIRIYIYMYTYVILSILAGLSLVDPQDS